MVFYPIVFDIDYTAFLLIAYRLPIDCLFIALDAHMTLPWAGPKTKAQGPESVPGILGSPRLGPWARPGPMIMINVNVYNVLYIPYWPYMNIYIYIYMIKGIYTYNYIHARTFGRVSRGIDLFYR